MIPSLTLRRLSLLDMLELHHLGYGLVLAYVSVIFEGLSPCTRGSNDAPALACPPAPAEAGTAGSTCMMCWQLWTMACISDVFPRPGVSVRSVMSFLRHNSLRRRASRTSMSSHEYFQSPHGFAFSCERSAGWNRYRRHDKLRVCCGFRLSRTQK